MLFNLEDALRLIDRATRLESPPRVLVYFVRPEVFGLKFLLKSETVGIFAPKLFDVQTGDSDLSK